MSQTTFKARDPDFAQRVRHSFARQEFMTFLGVELAGVSAGFAEIRLPYQKGLTQQHGFFHGGAIGTLADNAGGYAAFSLLSAKDAILTVEYKVNMMAPAIGDALVARGRVLRSGRQLSVSHTDVFSIKDGVEKLVATSLGTFMTVIGVADTEMGV